MRRTALFSLLLILGIGLLGVTAAVAVDDARLTIGDATVEPETPVVGAPTTVDVTLDLSTGSNQPADLKEVAIVEEVDRFATTDVASVSNLGTLSPGDSLTVPVTTVFDDPGQKDLVIVAEAETADGETVEVTRPLSIVVEDAPPMIDVESIDDTVVGTESEVELSVSNPLDDPIRNVAVEFHDDGGSIAPDSRSIPALGPGETETVTAAVEPVEAGDRTLEVALTYTTSGGTTASTERSVSYEAIELVADVGLQVRELPDEPEGDDAEIELDGVDVGGIFGGGGPAGGNPDGGDSDDSSSNPSNADDLGVVVTNFGNAPVTDVVVTPSTDQVTLPRLSIPGPIEPGESASVGVDLGPITDDPVTFETAFETAGVEGQESIVYQPTIDRGDVTVTGVDVEIVGDRATVSGNVGNPTDADVSGVVVAVNGTEFVEPAYPQRDYFVGSLDGGEFAPFDVTATVDAENASSIAIDLTYRTEVGPETERIELPIDRVEASPEPDTSEGIGLIVPLVAVVIVVAIGAAIVYRRRRRQSGDADSEL